MSKPTLRHAAACLATALSIASCKSTSGNDECPAGTRLTVVGDADKVLVEWGDDGPYAEVCVRADGTRYGPLVAKTEQGGRVTVRGQFVDGKRDGTWFSHNHTGARSMVTYRAGQAHGPEKWWHANGQLRWRGENRHGRRHGTWIRYGEQGDEIGRYQLGDGTGTRRDWYDNGKVFYETDYVDDVMHGEHQTYFPSGARQSHGTWKNGQKHGLWRRYAEDGTVTKEEHYRDGQLIEGPSAR